METQRGIGVNGSLKPRTVMVIKSLKHYSKSLMLLAALICVFLAKIQTAGIVSKRFVRQAVNGEGCDAFLRP